ncbi:MAG TPA: DNA repair protein RecO C-terminal domain-containing protein, partial [Gammaproteobacteria bacterium]|nr:DNA repair protein RecO C-terminal domain-containing protein [Gammaproteobacteria bacterium]
TYAEATHLLPLGGDHLLAGFYVNELLMRLLLKESPCGELFQAYEEILTALRAQEDLWVCLRIFEKALLKALGYELNLSFDAHSGAQIDHTAEYVYLLDQGPVRLSEALATEDKNYIFSGKSLLALAQNDLQDPIVRKQAKQLLQQAIQLHLGPRPLCSRDLFLSV